jgi:hypothetical protein
MMRSSSPSASGLGDLAIFGLFTGLSIIVGVFVVTVLMVMTVPVVAVFPMDSGAQEIILGISLMWGVVAGCVTAVFTIGSYRRMHVGTQMESLDAAESVPLEMIGRPIGRPVSRHNVANDRRRVRAASPVYEDDEDDEDELLLEEEAAEMPPRRAAGGRRYRRA